MNTNANTVLITGGSQGIGFETAKLLVAYGNRVIITGRNKKNLDNAVRLIPGVTGIVSDVTDAADTERLADTIRTGYPDLNVLINNAGIAHLVHPFDTENIHDVAGDEMNTNYFSVLRLIQKLLPVLRVQQQSAIVNVTSIVAIAPGVQLATYSATKAALHSYSQSLRLLLRETRVKVFELMPPLVATQFSKEIGGLEKGIPAAQVAAEFVKGFANDDYEIYVGDTAQVHALSKTSAEAALHAVNGIRS